MVIPFCRQGLWLTAWCGFVPLFFALRGKTGKQAFLLAYLSGITFWSGTIYWLVHVTLPGTLVLILYLSLYFAFFGLVSSYLLSANYYLLSIPSAWVTLEYIRSHLMTGFPWALLGYSQYKNLPVIQIADITGVWGVSFLVMMVNVSIFAALNYKARSKNQKIYMVAALGILAVVLLYGYLMINRKPPTGSQSLRVSVIQGNIPQALKWRAESEDYIFDRYLGLTEEALKENPDLIIWPEAALPVVLEEDITYFDSLRHKVKGYKTPLLFGAVTRREGFYYNSALLVEKGGSLTRRYDKIHLVPFGEYIPLRSILPFLETIVPIGDIEPGREYTLFEISSQKAKTISDIGVLICFEDLFPELSRAYAGRGADVLVNITNDAWYKYTAAPYQHLQASVFRAVENRRPLARAANTGISCFISSDGRIIFALKDFLGEEIFVRGFLSQDLPADDKILTLYTRFGDLFPLFCLVLAVYAIIRRNLRKK